MEAERIELADSADISRLADGLPWEVLKNIVTVQAHCVAIVDTAPPGDVKDLVGAISQNIRELAAGLAITAAEQVRTDLPMPTNYGIFKDRDASFAEQVRASEGGEEHAIRRWMETKGYSAAGLNSVIQLLNEIDYQARECGAAAEKVRQSVRAHD